MTVLRRILGWLSAWIDDVAKGLLRFGALFRRRRQIRLVEQPNGEFLARGPRRAAGGAPLRLEDGRLAGLPRGALRKLIAGGDVEVELAPSRFVFRPLELPSRAGEFLEGVVRAQIDRLTPWNAGDAAFGWSAPAPLGADRIAVTVAATARAGVTAIVEAVAADQPDSVRLVTRPDGADPTKAAIAVHDLRAGDALRARGLRRRLVGGLALACAAFVASLAAAIAFGDQYDSDLAQTQRRFAERRAALLSGQRSVADAALQALDAKKRETPASVIVLEAMSRALPDDTYLLELRIEDGKVQIAGQTRDAPELIRLIEQSGHFTHATFFAPTTRTANDKGESFHIEAHIEPQFLAAK